MKHYRILVLGKFRNWVSMYLHGVIEGTIANGWQSERVEIQKTDGADVSAQDVSRIQKAKNRKIQLYR